MKIYIAGPMRGYPEFNFPAFHQATRLIREAGHIVFSPAERDINDGFDPAGMTGADQDLVTAGFDLRDALRHDLAWITGHADAIVVLPGWEKSNGALAEMATARALSLPVWELAGFLLQGPAASMVQSASRCSCDNDPIECAHEAARSQAETKAEELNTTLERIGCILISVRDDEPEQYEVHSRNAETRYLEFRRWTMVQNLTTQLEATLSGQDLGCLHKAQAAKLTAEIDDLQGRLSDASDRVLELEAEASE